jgi:hypothetical protein
MSTTARQMEALIDQLKADIIHAAENPAFRHHKWYVKYHLAIVEQIANELLHVYTTADSYLVQALVWIHDYGKMITDHDDRSITLIDGRQKLVDIGFSKEFTERVIHYTELIDKKLELDLRNAPIEVQIVSSADGCAHLVGPFYLLWFWENPDTPFEDLMRSNRHKEAEAWERKIVLPEADAVDPDRSRHRHLPVTSRMSDASVESWLPGRPAAG